MLLDPYHYQTRAGDTLFRDVLSLALLGFLAIIVLLLPHVDPKGIEQSAHAPAPGNLIVELDWNDELNADVDLWVQAPGDVPVGYSNKGGVVFNLLRDDLGKEMDLSPNNHETAYTRGIAAGEYVINAHMYRMDNKASGDVKVSAIVSVKRSFGEPDKMQVVPLLFTSARLRYPGQELTLVRFKLTAEGTLVKNSVHSLFKGLRAKGAK